MKRRYRKISDRIINNDFRDKFGIKYVVDCITARWSEWNRKEKSGRLEGRWSKSHFVDYLITLNLERKS